MSELDLVRDADQNRYLARIEAAVVGLIDYAVQQDVITFLHTETDPAYQGQGIAGRLTRYALDDVSDRGLRLVPVCSYTQSYLERHPEYAGLLADPGSGPSSGLGSDSSSDRDSDSDSDRNTDHSSHPGSDTSSPSTSDSNPNTDSGS